MKKLPDTTGTISLDSIGERTKTRWAGTFKIRKVLTNADHFALERVYAQLLPSRERDIKDELKLRAAAVAELSVRIMEGPEWWNGTKGGQLMVDSNPLYDLIMLCNEEEKRWDAQVEEMSKFEDSNAVSEVQKPD